MFLQFMNYLYRFDKRKTIYSFFLQGAIFCFVDEGQCDDQLRAKYQYPGSFFSLVVFLDNLFHLGRCQGSHGDKYLSQRAPTSTFVLVSPSLARPVSFLSRRMSLNICNLTFLILFWNVQLQREQVPALHNRGSQQVGHQGWGGGRWREELERLREGAISQAKARRTKTTCTEQDGGCSKTCMVWVAGIFEGGLHSEEPAEDNDKKTKASSSLVRHRKRQVRMG